MDSSITIRDFLIAGSIVAIVMAYIGGLYTYLAATTSEGSLIDNNTELGLGDVEPAVRNLERARTELPNDRHAGNPAASSTNSDAT